MLPDPLDLRAVRDPEIIRLGEIVSAIRLVAPEEPLLLIGAQGRNLLLGWGLGITLQRATRDVDFALGVNDWEHFLGLLERLLGSGRFHASQTLHRLRFERPTGTMVDIVPFGGVEAEDRSIAWPPEHAITMSAIGFRESFAHSTGVALPGDVTVRVASLAALAALKLFAWTERAYALRSKDASDLGQVLDHYDRVVGSDPLYEAPDTVLEDSGGDIALLAAWHLGRDMAGVLASGDPGNPGPHAVPAPAERLGFVLRREADPGGPTQLAVDMGPAQLVRRLEQLEWLRRGLEAEARI